MKLPWRSLLELRIRPGQRVLVMSKGWMFTGIVDKVKGAQLLLADVWNIEEIRPKHSLTELGMATTRREVDEILLNPRPMGNGMVVIPELVQVLPTLRD